MWRPKAAGAEPGDDQLVEHGSWLEVAGRAASANAAATSAFCPGKRTSPKKSRRLGLMDELPQSTVVGGAQVMHPPSLLAVDQEEVGPRHQTLLAQCRSVVLAILTISSRAGWQ